MLRVRHINNKRELHKFQFHGILEPDADQEQVCRLPPPDYTRTTSLLHTVVDAVNRSSAQGYAELTGCSAAQPA